MFSIFPVRNRPDAVEHWRPVLADEAVLVARFPRVPVRNSIPMSSANSFVHSRERRDVVEAVVGAVNGKRRVPSVPPAVAQVAAGGRYVAAGAVGDDAKTREMDRLGDRVGRQRPEQVIDGGEHARAHVVHVEVAAVECVHPVARADPRRALARRPPGVFDVEFLFGVGHRRQRAVDQLVGERRRRTDPELVVPEWKESAQVAHQVRAEDVRGREDHHRADLREDDPADSRRRARARSLKKRSPDSGGASIAMLNITDPMQWASTSILVGSCGPGRSPSVDGLPDVVYGRRNVGERRILERPWQARGRHPATRSHVENPHVASPLPEVASGVRVERRMGERGATGAVTGNQQHRWTLRRAPWITRQARIHGPPVGQVRHADFADDRWRQSLDDAGQPLRLSGSAGSGLRKLHTWIDSSNRRK